MYRTHELNQAPMIPVSRKRDLGAAIDVAGTVVVFRANREIFGFGDAATGWYKVLSGCVRTVRLFADGRRQILEFLLPGDFFGFDCVARYDTSAEAVTRATLARYPRSRLETLVESDHRSARIVREMISEKLQAARRHALLLGRTADDRVASFLLDIRDRQGEAGAEIDLPMSRRDIADHLGLTLETVSRVISRFKRDGTIDLPSATRIHLRDPDALLDLDAHPR